MFYLKNDDMEELFRKAAENYEVDTQKASDWGKVHTALHGESNLPEGSSLPVGWRTIPGKRTLVNVR